MLTRGCGNSIAEPQTGIEPQGGALNHHLHKLGGANDVNYRGVCNYGLQKYDATVAGRSHQHIFVNYTGPGGFASQRGAFADQNRTLLNDDLPFIGTGPQEANAAFNGLVTYDVDTVRGAALQWDNYGISTAVGYPSSYHTSVAPFGNQRDGVPVGPVPIPTNPYPISSPGVASVFGSQDGSFISPGSDTLSEIPTPGTATSVISGRFTCLHPGCVRSFGRSSDLKRHMGKHDTGTRPFNCYVDGCKYNGAKGFYRRDKLVDHQKAKHGMHMPVPDPSMNAGGY